GKRVAIPNMHCRAGSRRRSPRHYNPLRKRMKDEGERIKFRINLSKPSSFILLPSSFLLNLHHSWGAFDQWFTAGFGDQHAAAPTGVETPIGAVGDRLDDEDAVFFNQQIAIAPAVILRRKQRAIVAIATAMHKQLAFHAALGAK